MSNFRWRLIMLVPGILTSMNAQADNAIVSVGERPSYASVVEHGRTLIKKEMSKNKAIAGLSVALVDSEHVIWSEGFGWASKINQQALTSDSAMLMGSVSKVFTAIAVMQLVEQGEIDLDAAYSDYVPEFRIKTHNPSWPAFTIRQMMQHSSGLPGNYAKGFFLDLPESPATTSYRELPKKVAELFLTNPPEREHRYSNLAFSLLGLLVERVSGEYFPDYMNQHILDPLGMSHSSFLFDERVQSRLAQSIEGKKEAGYDYLRDLSAGSLAATSDDIARFMIALLNNGDKILKAETLEEMFSQQNEITTSHDVSAPKMGLGFCVELPDRLQGLRAAWHNGGIRTDYALMITLPESGLGMAMMTSYPISGVVDQLVEDVLAKAYEAKTGHTLPEAVVPKKLRLTEAQAKKYSGYYETGGGIWEITRAGNKLKMKTNTGEVLDMIHYEDGTFSLKYKLFGFIPLGLEVLEGIRLNPIVGDRQEVQFRFQIGYISVIIGEHFSPIKPVTVPPSWKALVGEYEIDNMTPRFRKLRRQQGKSKIMIEWQEDTGFLLFDGAPIRPISDTYAITMGRGRGETLEIRPDGRLFFAGLLISKK